MMETTIVLLIFFIMISIGIIFYIIHQKSQIKVKQAEHGGLELVKKSQVLNFMPELQCSSGGIINNNCYDAIKLAEFLAIYEANKFFFNNYLGYVKIEVTEFDPSPGVEVIIRNWLLYDNSKADFNIMRKLELPVTIYNATADIKTFGIISLEAYS